MDKKNGSPTAIIVVGFIILLVIFSLSRANHVQRTSESGYEQYQEDQQGKIDAVEQDVLDIRDSTQYFRGRECTVDCSGHEAGYDWAQEHGISDVEDCGGNSESFIEGCESYAEELDNNDSDYYSDDY